MEIDIREKLETLKKDELVSLARELKATGYSGLNREQLIRHVLLNCPEREISAFLDKDSPQPPEQPTPVDGKVPWWKRSKIIQFTIIFGIIGTIVTIVAFLLSVGQGQESTETLQSIKKKLENFDPLKRDEIVKQLEEKRKELETELKDEKYGDTKESKEALKALQNRDYKKAQEFFDSILKKQEKVKEKARTAYNLGNSYYVDWKYKKALNAYLEACELVPGNALYLNNTGIIYDILADYSKAIYYYQKALDVDLKTYGESHPKVAIRWNNLGSAWESLGEYKKAIEYYQKALDVDLKTYGDSHPSVARDWNNLGSAWESLGDYKKAIYYYQKALAVDLKTYGDSHPNVAIRWNNLGSAWYKLGKYRKALGYLKKALNILETKLGPNHPNTKNVKIGIAVVREKMGKGNN